MYACLQVECADFVVLNKTDLLAAGPVTQVPGAEIPEDATALDQLVAIVSSLNPLATVVPCQQGQVRGFDGCSIKVLRDTHAAIRSCSINGCSIKGFRHNHAASRGLQL